MSLKKIDNYRIRMNEIMGVGGNTYLGFNNINKEQVVIKIFDRTQLANIYPHTQYFKNQVKHSHTIRKAAYIVRYLNLLETNNHFYLILEYCKGGNLRKVINDKRITMTQAFKYLRHILKGFIELVKKGILHGNLTPNNILLNNGLMRISDFGLNNISALLSSHVSHTRQINFGQSNILDIEQKNKTIINEYKMHRLKGTTYLAPQVLKGEKYTQKSDIWSLGLIYYEMLYGYVPWKTGRSIKTYEYRILSQPINFTSIPQISYDQEQFIRGCLQPNPTKRLSWQMIYSHPMFNNQFAEIISLDIRRNYILGEVRSGGNFSLNACLSKSNLTNQTMCNYQHFSSFIKNVHPKINQNDIQYLFSTFNLNEKDQICFSQVRDIFQRAEIIFEPLQNVKKNSKKWLDPQLMPFQQNTLLIKQQSIEQIIQKLIKSLKIHNIDNLAEIYTIEQLQSSKIDFVRFIELIRKIRSDLTYDQGTVLWGTIDQNGVVGVAKFLTLLKHITTLRFTIYK